MTMGYRSMSEVRFAAKLITANLKFAYEAKKLSYQYKPQKYVVDYTIDNVLIEYKGKLDAAGRKKMQAVKMCNPDADLIIVFEKPNNKLYRGAKSTYGDWATKNGYTWFDYRDMDKIKDYILQKRTANNNARKTSKATTKSGKAQPKGMAKATTRGKVQGKRAPTRKVRGKK